MFNFLKNGNEEFLRLEVFKLAKLVHEHDKEVIFDTNEFKLFRVFFIDNFLNRSYEDNLKEVIEEFSAKKKNKNMLSDLYHSLASYEEALKSIPFEMAKKYAISNGANHSNYENNPEDDVLLFWIDVRRLWEHFTFSSYYDDGNPFLISMDNDFIVNSASPYDYGISIMKGSNYGEKGTIIQCESKLRMIIGMNG